MADVTVDISDIITEFGAFYKKGSQGVKNLHKQILETTDSDELFQLMPTDDTRLEGANVDIGGVLQGYQDAFTPLGQVDFTGRVIDLYPVKIDWQKNPTAIWKTWLGFLAGLPNDIDRKNWPFIKYILEELIMPKAKRDWELSGIYKGTVGAVTPGTANPILTGVLGWRKQMNLAVTAGDLVPIALGAVPTNPSDFVTYVEAFVDGIDPAFYPLLQNIAFSQTLLKRFKKGMRAKYNMYYDQADNVTVIDTNLKVQGYASHEGSTKIWTTVRGNTALGIKNPGNAQVFKIESVDRTVKLFTDYWKGVGCFRWDMVFTNDVDLT